MNNVKSFFQSYFLFFIIAIGLKFIFSRYLLFRDYNILNAIWYELSIVIILFAIVELLLKRWKLTAYIFLDLILTFVIFGMAVYERYFGTIPTYYDLGQLNQVGSVSESALMLISWRDAFFLLDFFVLVFLLVIRRKIKFPININFSKKYISIALIICLLVSLSNFMLHRNERILDQTLFSEKNGILNSQLIKAYSETIGSSNSEEIIEDVTINDIISLKGNDPVPFEEHKYFNMAEGKNLIIVQIESLQDFVINLEVNGQEITPNLNQWVDDSFYFTDVFQQIGAGNTSDAEFMMNTSIYPVGETPSSKHVANKDIPSLPSLLNEEGYLTTTFHADTIKYWDRDLLYPALDFDKNFSSENYFEEKDVIGFGPSDGYFYEKTMEKLVEFNQENKKFYSHVLSLTSHSPFELPEDKKMLDLPAKYNGTLIGNYLQSIHYADYALGKFFDDLKEKGLWNKSVIALYGDHSGVHGQLIREKDVKLLNELLGHPYSLVNRFNIPFMVGIPGKTEEIGTEINNVGGQLDMMPTILNLMGIKPKGLYFGHDLLQYKHNLLGMRYYLATGSFINNDVLFIPKTSKRSIRIYDLEGKNRFNDLSDPMEHFENNYANILQLYKWSDAYFESLSK